MGTDEVPVEPIYFTLDEINTIRITISAVKEELCNQRRWAEALEYEGIVDKLIALLKRKGEIKQ